MTQNADTLHLLRYRGQQGITALDAQQTVGTMRLAARIADLRGQGYNISTTIEATATGKHIARYRLVETDQLRFPL